MQMAKNVAVGVVPPRRILLCNVRLPNTPERMMVMRVSYDVRRMRNIVYPDSENYDCFIPCLLIPSTAVLACTVDVVENLVQEA